MTLLDTTTRTPAGSSAGGRFAPRTRTSPSSALEPDEPAQHPPLRGGLRLEDVTVSLRVEHVTASVVNRSGVVWHLDIHEKGNPAPVATLHPGPPPAELEHVIGQEIALPTAPAWMKDQAIDILRTDNSDADASYSAWARRAGSGERATND